MADTKKFKLVSIEVKVKRDGSGEYYLVKTQDAEGVQQPECLCFDKKVTLLKPGDIFEGLTTEKDGKWFLNFPGEKKAYTGAAGGKKSDDFAKISGLLQAHTMPMSYAKDLVVAMINKGWDCDTKIVAEAVLAIYTSLHNVIVIDPAIQAVLGARDDTAKKTVDTVRVNFADEIKWFSTGLSSLGWLVPDGSIPRMLKRLSQGKDSQGHAAGGHDKIMEMTDQEVQLARDRFKMFQQKECPGDPKECKYYKNYLNPIVVEPGVVEPPPDHYCSWTLYCFYAQNKTGRGTD